MRKRPIGQRTIDEATARRISVQLGCDPRTVKKAARGEVKSFVARAVKQALVAQGILKDQEAA